MMHLTDIYSKGEKYLGKKEFGFLLDDVETGFIRTHDRKILDRYTFRQHCIDAAEPDTSCRVLGIDLATPVIMSAISAPIPAIAEDGLLQVAAGLKEAGSLMWVGSPSPRNLDELVTTSVPIAANVKPLSDRRKMFSSLEEIQKAGVQWVGIEVDAGLGTKIRDRQVVSDCAPLSLKELKAIRKNVSVTLIFKGVLSGTDAIKSVEAGADGIVVSNHGAHTLDYLPHPLQLMEEIVDVVQERVVLILDGSFRRGSDVFKGLAFGASLVGLGRPILYGLAADGRDGVRMVVEQITTELRRIMTMVGVPQPGKVNREFLVEDPR